VVSKKPSRRLYERMVSARLEACDNDKALAAVDKGVAVYPDSTGLWKLKGWICYGRNQFDFCLAGTSTHRYHRLKGQKNIFEFTPRPGMNVISSLSDVCGDMDFHSQEKIACVGLKVDPQLLFSYLEQQMDTVPKELATLFDKGDSHHCFLTRQMTPQMPYVAG
jgi:hypothetical protein